MPCNPLKNVHVYYDDLISVCCFQENYVSVISSLWEGYPHATMPFMIKFYYLIQIGYWIHCLPELYFQKVKKVAIVFSVVVLLLGMFDLSLVTTMCLIISKSYRQICSFPQYMCCKECRFKMKVFRYARSIILTFHGYIKALECYGLL